MSLNVYSLANREDVRKSSLDCEYPYYKGYGCWEDAIRAFIVGNNDEQIVWLQRSGDDDVIIVV
jgi:hypothetical protein